MGAFYRYLYFQAAIALDSHTPSAHLIIFNLNTNMGGHSVLVATSLVIFVFSVLPVEGRRRMQRYEELGW